MKIKDFELFTIYKIKIKEYVHHLKTNEYIDVVSIVVEVNNNIVKFDDIIAKELSDTWEINQEILDREDYKFEKLNIESPIEQLKIKYPELYL
jgi:predicted transglutaminase-like cysteine proteinase